MAVFQGKANNAEQSEHHAWVPGSLPRQRSRHPSIHPSSPPPPLSTLHSNPAADLLSAVCRGPRQMLPGRTRAVKSQTVS